MAGLHQFIAFNEAGEAINQGSGRGSCTGMWCFGHERLNNGTVSLQQAFGCIRHYSDSAFHQIAATAIMQGLVPGMTYTGNMEGNPSFLFPNVHILPSDQVVTAMRMLKSFLGYNISSELREYEFSMDEYLPIALFYNKTSKTSDGFPLLARATKAQLLAHYEENAPHGNNWMTMAANLRSVPTAGAILPLIRGEIRQGYQLPLIKGYYKENALLDPIPKGVPPVGRDWDNPPRGLDLQVGLRKTTAVIRDLFNSMPDDASYSVNHPIIHFTEEAFSGPVISHHDNTPVLEWLANSLGK